MLEVGEIKGEKREREWEKEKGVNKKWEDGKMEN